MSSHFIKNLKKINIFFEQATHNVITSSRILDGLTNFNVECEEVKHNVCETNNQLWTCNLKLIIVQQNLKN
jgi:hypothetical protein